MLDGVKPLSELCWCTQFLHSTKTNSSCVLVADPDSDSDIRLDADSDSKLGVRKTKLTLRKPPQESC